MIVVDSPDDPRLADYVGLTDPDLRRLREQSGGAEGGFFIAEGALVVRQLVASPYRIRSFLLTPLRYSALASVVDGVGAPVYVAEQAVVDAVSGFPLHRGALASADRTPMVPVAEVVAGARLVVVTEGVNDHENLGALFRNAAAFGVGAVVLDPTSCDPLYRRAVRVSMGHVLHVPFTVAADAVGAVQSLGFEVLALTPSPDAEDIGSVRPSGPCAVLVGAEGPGLSAEAIAAADRRVRIPMAPGVDSLNVATAAAIALHHLAPTSF